MCAIKVIILLYRGSDMSAHVLLNLLNEPKTNLDKDSSFNIYGDIAIAFVRPSRYLLH